MARPENQYLIPKIKAARGANIRPTSMIFYEQPTDPWVPFDFLLLEAFQRLEDEICPKCGHPVWLCRSTSADIDWQVKTDTCYATKAMEVRETTRGKKGKDRAKAVKEAEERAKITYVIPATPKGRDIELPTREQYYNELQAKHEAMKHGKIDIEE